MEPARQNNSINAINDMRMLINELRNNLLCEETKRIRKKLYRIEAVYNVLKEKEQKGSLTSRQKNMLSNDERYLKNLKKDLQKSQKYSITYGLDYLFNELDEVDYYERKTSRALLMVVMRYMKVKDIKILNCRYTNILT